MGVYCGVMGGGGRGAEMGGSLGTMNLKHLKLDIHLLLNIALLIGYWGKCQPADGYNLVLRDKDTFIYL